MKKVAVIMGSDSDLPVVEKAINTLKEFEVPCEVHVFSAHRTPKESGDFAKTAKENGFGVIIAAAGMAAHLAGAIAANTVLPVIGIPVSSKVLDGMDALLSTVMMPPGMPVATVGINTLIWEDNFKLFMNSYADMLPNFDMRVAFTMPDDDSINFDLLKPIDSIG